MKKIFKIFGFIALIMVIGFLMAACLSEEKPGDGDDGNDGGGGGGGTGTKPTVTIKNNTGYTIGDIYFKPSTETREWGNDYLWHYDMKLEDKKSGDYTLDQPLTVHNVYDIQLNGGGYNFVKFGVTVSNRMTITFTTADLNNLSSLPKITIQNRSGKNFDSVFIVPSALNPTNPDDWGKDFGSAGNNSDKTDINILVAPTNYTVFDIQARSSNPTNTYNKKNVTVTNGMTVLFTPLDRTNPTIEDPVIVVINNTGYNSNNVSADGVRIKASGAEWGNQLWGYLPNNNSRSFSVSKTLGSQIDVKLTCNDGAQSFVKSNLPLADSVLTFTMSDLVPVVP